MGDTLLLVCPPDDPLGLLADSVGGGRVPMRGRVNGVWANLGYDERCFADAFALPLQLDGTPDEIGMGRALAVLERMTSRTYVNRVARRYEPWPVAHAILMRAPTYRLATLAADGREKES